MTQHKSEKERSEKRPGETGEACGKSRKNTEHRTCQGCAGSRTDCGEGYSCANISTGDGLPDYRDVSSCTADGECGSGTCKDTADQYGVAAKGCMPTSCQ